MNNVRGRNDIAPENPAVRVEHVGSISYHRAIVGKAGSQICTTSHLPAQGFFAASIPVMPVTMALRAMMPMVAVPVIIHLRHIALRRFRKHADRRCRGGSGHRECKEARYYNSRQQRSAHAFISSWVPQGTLHKIYNDQLQ
jgi:hypothetical protein